MNKVIKGEIFNIFHPFELKKQFIIVQYVVLLMLDVNNIWNLILAPNLFKPCCKYPEGPILYCDVCYKL